MQTDPVQRKKMITYALLIAVGVVLLIGVVWYFTHSFIIVKTSTSAVVSVSKDGVEIASGKGASYFAAITPGDYSISVKDGDKRTVTFASFHGGQISTYNLSPKNISSTHIVAPFSASNLVSDGTNLSFTDNDSATAGYITIGSQTIRALSSDHFSSLSWRDSAHGFGVASLPGDNQNGTKLVAIKNGEATEYSLPAGTNSLNQSVAITPSDVGLYAGGKSLYKQDGVSMKRIYTADHQITILAATSDTALVAETIQADGDSMVVRIDRVTYDGSVTKGVELSFHPNPNLTLSGAFSPDGSRIVVSSMGIAAVYTQDFNLVTKLPLQTEIASAIWKDNSTVLYSAGNQVFSYSLDSHIADVIGVTEPGSTLSSLYYDQKNNSVFVTTTGATSTDSIQRFYLSNDTTTSVAEKTLVSYLPRDFTLLYCKASFSTLVQPTVILDQRTSGNDSQNASDCIDAAKQMFDEYNIDSSQFRYQTLLP